MASQAKGQKSIGAGMTVSPDQVVVVLLNYMGAEDTLACLRSFEKMPDKPAQVIVVDNGSSDDQISLIRDGWKEISGTFPSERYGREVSAEETPGSAVFLRLDENEGYSAGNNVGILYALAKVCCRAVWILNNDTEPEPGSLQALCDRLNTCPKGGMAGSTLVHAHDRATVQCAGGFTFDTFTGVTAALYGNEKLSTVLTRDPLFVERRLDYLCGASMLVRREVFERIGHLAEEFFLYYEDAEFGLRARKAGYDLAWAPSSVVFHKEGGSTGAVSSGTGRALKRSPLVDYLALRNRIYLLRCYFPWFLPFAVASFAGVMVNRLRRGQVRRFPLVCKALVDGMRGKMGKPDAVEKREKGQKILFMTLRADFGGGPEHLWQLLRHAPESVRPYVACPEDYPYYERYREIVGSAYIFTLPHRIFNLRKLWQLRNFSCEHSISVLHSHGKGAGLYSRILAMMTGLPCIHTFHGVHMNGYSLGKRHIYRLYERIMSWFTKVGIAVSEGEREQIIAEGLMPASKLCLIPNGVGIPSMMTVSETSPSSAIVSLSRFDYQKNSMFLLDIAKALSALGRLEEFQIIVVGDGVDRQALASSAQANGWESHILCPGASTHPHSFFEGALCYLSTSRWEGMPLAVLEAMAHGLPVVASDVVGNKDAVSHGVTGFLYREGDAIAAATALCQLANNPSLCLTMGESARAYVQSNHSIKNMVAKTYDVLQEAARRV